MAYTHQEILHCPPHNIRTRYVQWLCIFTFQIGYTLPSENQRTCRRNLPGEKLLVRFFCFILGLFVYLSVRSYFLLLFLPVKSTTNRPCLSESQVLLSPSNLRSEGHTNYKCFESNNLVTLNNKNVLETTAQQRSVLRGHASHNAIETANKSCKNVAMFNCLGATVT
jgi:hypothetical protein